MAEKKGFNPQFFIDDKTREIRRILGKEKAIIACSGGVDSTTGAVLTRLAIGDNLICVFMDTNFMRLGEPERVVGMLSEPPLGLPVRLLQAQEKFMKAMRGLKDAEEKRKAFRSTFYTVLSGAAAEENCHFLVQGTILPDIIETVKGIKTQHNVLEQMKIDTKKVYGFKVVEPLVSLYKPQVREVARMLGAPLEASERQPFPGPGLSVRVVGEITPEKLDAEKKATVIVEEKLERLSPKQYFPATIDAKTVKYAGAKEAEDAISGLLKGKDVTVKVQALKTRATGIRAGARLYGKIVTVDARNKSGICAALPSKTLSNIQERVTLMDKDVSRVLYQLMDEERKGKWVVAVRAIETSDFVTAKASDIPWKTLREIGEQVMGSCGDVATVYYDITPKPPASIEFE